MDEKMKRAQVTLWIILAIMLVAAAILFFSIDRDIKPIRLPGGDSDFDVQTYLDSCTRDYVEDVVDEMILHGGFVNPGNSVLFNNTEIEYLCKNVGFYEPCINQHPMLLNEMKSEIHSEVLLHVNSCLDDMKNDFEGRGSDVVFEGPSSLEVDLASDRIVLKINRKTTINKGEDSRRLDNYDIEIVNPVHNLASIAMEIAAQEAKYCYFEYVGYSILYPRYKIKKFVMSEPTKIYSIMDLKSGKEMNMAIRGCAIPAGF